MITIQGNMSLLNNNNLRFKAYVRTKDARFISLKQNSLIHTSSFLFYQTNVNFHILVNFVEWAK